jgi:O-glycosyl hydrolase
MDKSGLEDKKIIVWDHNRDLMNHRQNVIFDDPKASKMLGEWDFIGTKTGRGESLCSRM